MRRRYRTIRGRHERLVACQLIDDFLSSERTRKLTIVSRRFELIRHLKRQILLLHRSYVDMLDRARLSDNRSQLDAVYKGFFQGDILNT